MLVAALGFSFKAFFVLPLEESIRFLFLLRGPSAVVAVSILVILIN